MSTWLDFRCQGCGEDAGNRVYKFGSMNEHMLAILAAREGLAILGEKAAGVSVVLGYDSARVETAWFATHKGHDLVLVNGYGDICNGTPDAWTKAPR